MSTIALAYRYSLALFESATDDASRSADAQDLLTVQTLLQQLPDLAKFCQNPHTGQRAATDLVNLAFIPKVGLRVARMLQIIATNGRLAIIPLLHQVYDRINSKHGTTIRALLECANPIDSDLVANMQKQLEQRTGRTVQLAISLQPSLLGGFRIFWQNRLLDASLRSHINHLRHHLHQAQQDRIQ